MRFEPVRDEPPALFTQHLDRPSGYFQDADDLRVAPDHPGELLLRATDAKVTPVDGQKLCDNEGRPGTCPFTGEPSAKRVVWAKSY